MNNAADHLTPTRKRWGNNERLCATVKLNMKGASLRTGMFLCPALVAFIRSHMDTSEHSEIMLGMPVSFC